MDRPAHSILFICLSAVLLAYVAKRLGARNGLLVKIAFAAPISILAHIAYDVFAANVLSWYGSNFPLFIPLSYSMIDFPNYAWIVLEAAAFVGALLVQLCSDNPILTVRASEDRSAKHKSAATGVSYA